jgi:hypothetical protein
VSLALRIDDVLSLLALAARPPASMVVECPGCSTKAPGRDMPPPSLSAVRSVSRHPGAEPALDAHQRPWGEVDALDRRA